MSEMRDLLPLTEWFEHRMKRTLGLPKNVSKPDWRLMKARDYVALVASHVAHLKDVHEQGDDMSCDEFVGHCVDAANLMMMAAGVVANETQREDL